jgi:hypothetical protein
MQTPFESWAARYKPFQNTIADHGMYDGRLFGLTGREKLAVEAAQYVWTLTEHDGVVELLYGQHLTNRLGYFITEVPYAGETDAMLRLANPGKDTPERAAMALTRAQQWRAVDVAGDHEHDLIDWCEGRITEAEYRTNEDRRNAYVDGVKVFFNLWLNEYCVEDEEFTDIPCGRCGIVYPRDPCRGCGRPQPVALEDYYRANARVIELPEATEGEPAEEPFLEDANCPF